MMMVMIHIRREGFSELTLKFSYLINLHDIHKKIRISYYKNNNKNNENTTTTARSALCMNE